MVTLAASRLGLHSLVNFSSSKEYSVDLKHWEFEVWWFGNDNLFNVVKNNAGWLQSVELWGGL